VDLEAKTLFRVGTKHSQKQKQYFES